MDANFEFALRRGQAAGAVSASVDPRRAAFALVAEIEGILSLSRNSQDRRVLRLGLQSLRGRLEAMRPSNSNREATEAGLAACRRR